MTLQSRWDPFTVLARLDPEFDDLVRRAWGTSTGQPSKPERAPGSTRAATAGYVPAVEVCSDGADVVITVELPGVDVARDVDIEVASGRLMISGERREMRRDGRDGAVGGAGVLVRELRYGAFRREFALPDHVGAEDVDASYDRGMLVVRVRSVAKPVEAPKKVAIRAAGDQQAVQTTAEDADRSE